MRFITSASSEADFEDELKSLIQPSIKNVPLAGFFCAGEIGPIAGVNYLHGHIAALALFRPSA